MLRFTQLSVPLHGHYQVPESLLIALSQCAILDTIPGACRRSFSVRVPEPPETSFFSALTPSGTSHSNDAVPTTFVISVLTILCFSPSSARDLFLPARVLTDVVVSFVTATGGVSPDPFFFLNCISRLFLLF